MLVFMSSKCKAKVEKPPGDKSQVDGSLYLPIGDCLKDALNDLVLVAVSDIKGEHKVSHLTKTLDY